MYNYVACIWCDITNALSTLIFAIPLAIAALYHLIVNRKSKGDK